MSRLSEELLGTRPAGQAAGSLAWSLPFASVGTMSGERPTKRCGKALGLNLASAGFTVLGSWPTDVGGRKTKQGAEIGGGLRATEQRLTDEKRGLREGVSCAKATQPGTGGARIQTQMDFTSKPFLLPQAFKGLDLSP